MTSSHDTATPDSPGTRSERFQARLSLEQKAQLERAAGYAGQSLTDFVIESAQRRAAELIHAHEVLHLNADDSRSFVSALLNPPAPSERMRALAKHYQAEVEER